MQSDDLREPFGIPYHILRDHVEVPSLRDHRIGRLGSTCVKSMQDEIREVVAARLAGCGYSLVDMSRSESTFTAVNESGDRVDGRIHPPSMITDGTLYDAILTEATKAAYRAAGREDLIHVES